MRPIDRNEILGLAEYEQVRGPFRARVIEEKRHRRVALGEHISALFENRDTVLLQIQEMLRTERITTEGAIAHEIETYNELLPAKAQLSVTLYVEVPEKTERDRLLVELAGLEDAVGLEVDGQLHRASGKRQGAEPGRTTAVHYLKIDLGADASVKLASRSAKVTLVVDHPRYRARTPLSEATLVRIAEDVT